MLTISNQGILLKINRLIQVEGAFRVLKKITDLEDFCLEEKEM